MVQLQDQIFAWVVSLPSWQQELFLRALGGRPLSRDRLDEIVAMALGDPNALKAAHSVERKDLPADLPVGAVTQILDITHVDGVNRLAPGETLPLIRDGVNVIYGHNGAGKSGWARVLKHAGRAREKMPVLGDAFVAADERPRPAARIRWQFSGAQRTLELALDEEAPGDLAGMCVYDAVSATRLLSDDQEVDYVPRALEAVQRMASAQVSLVARVRERIQDLSDSPLDLTAYEPGSRAYEALINLSPVTDLAQLRELASLSADEHDRFLDLTRQINEVDARSAGPLAAAADREAESLEALAAALRAAAVHVGHAAITAAVEEAAAVAAAESTVAGMSALQFADEPLAGVATEPWVVMWTATKRFMQEVNGIAFPDAHDPGHCPLCMQTIGADASERLQRFERWVRSDVETQLKDAREVLERRRSALPSAETLRTTHAASLAALGVAHRPLAQTVTTWIGELSQVVSRLRIGDLDGVAAVAGPPVAELDAMARCARVAAAEHRLLDNPTEQAARRAELVELTCRQQLATDMPSIERRVQRLAAAAELDRVLIEIATGPVSNKLRTLARDFIAGDLERELKRQLNALNFDDLEMVGCRTSGREGTPRVGLKVQTRGREAISLILSDGEQRRLALAFFLAEGSVAYVGQPLVLDDPVCSIDHQGRRHIARTLARVAKDRQVIVFTHELAFLHELEAATKAEAVQLHAQHVVKTGGRTGVVRTDLPWTGKTAARRAKELNLRLQEIQALHRQDGDSAEYAAGAVEFCRLLRQAFERTIEDDVLAGVLTRQDPGVHLQQLGKVAWTDEICQLSDRGLADASPWVHDSSRALNPSPPTPAELAEGLGVLKALRVAVMTVVSERSTAAAAALQVPGEAAPQQDTAGDVRTFPGMDETG